MSLYLYSRKEMQIRMLKKLDEIDDKMTLEDAYLLGAVIIIVLGAMHFIWGW